MVELAELLVERVAHADWAIFAKNGTDATTTRPDGRAGRRPAGNKVLAAGGAYHGGRAVGDAPAGRRRARGARESPLLHLQRHRERRARDRRGRRAATSPAIIISPFRHDAGFDQELVDPAFARAAARAVRRARRGARARRGPRRLPPATTAAAGSTLGVQPDLSAWSKAHRERLSARRHPGQAGRYADAASRIFVTGSFWFQAVPMAAAIATITRAARRRRGRGHGARRDAAAGRASSSLRRTSESRSARPARCRCRT